MVAVERVDLCVDSTNNPRMALLADSLVARDRLRVTSLGWSCEDSPFAGAGEVKKPIDSMRKCDISPTPGYR